MAVSTAMNIFRLRLLKLFGSTERYSEDINNKDYHRSGLTTASRVTSSCKILERILTENIIPFWYPKVIDAQDGGYRLNHDLEGRYQGPAKKCLVTQARTLWFFSRLANSRYGGPDHLEAARHGLAFMRDRMWDQQFGGFYWEVDSSGHGVSSPQKHIYGQAFALYALTEYATASGDSSAKTTAKEVFTLIETKAHDQRYGGYGDIFQRDWTPLSSTRRAHVRDRVPVKRMNTHLHLLEAITTFVALTDEPVAHKRLIELILVNSNSVVRKDIGACTEKYLENWRPFVGPNDRRVSYGHDVENVRLLAEACRTAGIPENLLADLYRTIFKYALDYGFDQKDGGFYDSGFPNAPADRRNKIWWVQAEGLVAALQMYRFTGEPLYWDCFALVLDWIVKHQVDWKHGDWFEMVDDGRKPSGVKAGPWKGPYHNGRAMLQCLEMLSEFESAGTQVEPASHKLQ